MALSTSPLTSVVIGNGKPPALPIHLAPQRLRQLAAFAAYAEGQPARQGYPLKAPFTGETIATVPAGTPADVAEAFRRARLAQRGWALRPASERAAVFKRYHDRVLEGQEEVLDLIQLESGKSRIDAFEEVGDVAFVSRYYAYHGPRILARTRAPGAVPILTRTEVGHVPVGVVGIIAPWNYPLSMAITDAIPALLAGNAVVLKPAEQTPFTALWAARLLVECGLPRDLIQVIPGHGSEIGTPIIEHADFVHFTGSTAVGRKVAEQCGHRLIGCSLELGGKNALVVLEDADLDRAAAGAVKGIFASAGQLCISLERVYVQEHVYDAFLQRLTARVAALRVKAGYRYDADMGSLVSPDQFDKVTAHVEDARAKGATVLTGGRPLPEAGPLFYAPTVLTGVTEEMDVYREETFGPVASVYRFREEAEALARVNDSDYGLNASIWTTDAQRGLRFARRVEAGTVNINDAYAPTWASVAAPMGGFKQSGQGRRHGPEGILKYTEKQNVALQRFLPIAPPPGMAQRDYAGLLTRALKLWRHVPGLR